MSTRVRMTAGWERHLQGPIEDLLAQITEASADEARSRVAVDTGELKSTIYSEVSNGVGRVGATADHAAEVELGTSTQSAQPYLRPAVLHKRSQ